MTSSKTNSNYDEVMKGVNNALPQITDGLHRLADRTASAAGIAVHQPQTAKSAPGNIAPSIYKRISDNLDRVKNMLNGEKAEEYGDPQVMFRNISQRWFDVSDAEDEVAFMMAELKIARIKYDPSKEDSYLDAIAYLVMALSFMQERKNND